MRYILKSSHCWMVAIAESTLMWLVYIVPNLKSWVWSFATEPRHRQKMWWLTNEVKRNSLVAFPILNRLTRHPEAIFSNFWRLHHYWPLPRTASYQRCIQTSLDKRKEPTNLFQVEPPFHIHLGHSTTAFWLIAFIPWVVMIECIASRFCAIPHKPNPEVS